jgi:elongator complex protein 5
VSFNLNLTLEQQQQRAKVPLPYAHEGVCCLVSIPHAARLMNVHLSKGKPAESAASAPVGAIYYDPDSADDIDDDDPDEDLDI